MQTPRRNATGLAVASCYTPRVTTLRELIRKRLADETGRLVKEAPYTVALAYPSPYAAAISSLGYQRIYRAIMETSGMACERAFLGDGGSGTDRGPERPLTYESERPLDAFPVVAVSVAYELELGGLVQLLDAAGIPPRRTDRDDRHPVILAGGPLTFSNPLPLAGMVDAVILGEAEEITPRVLAELRAVGGPGQRARQLESPGDHPPRLRPDPSRRCAPRGRQSRRLHHPGVGPHPHPPRRAVWHVPDRDRAWLLGRALTA